VTVFAVREPCAMCIGALLESDADGLVFALTDPTAGGAGAASASAAAGSGRRLAVVSGIMSAQAGELLGS